MNKVYKICLAIAVLAVVFAFGNFAWAQGRGYFLEKGQEFFIFDNLYINGFLAVEKQMATPPRTGLFGDVLLGDTLNLDSTKAFNFCKDTRQAVTNAPLNKNCADKVLIWNPDSFDIVNNTFYEMQVNNIKIAGSTILLKSLANGATINTKSPVRLTGCFTNATGANNNFCSPGELKTNKFYLNGFSNLNICKNGTNDGKVCNSAADCPGGTCNLNEVVLNPSNLIFNNINLGDESNLGSQNLCTITSAVKTAATTPTCPGGSGTNRPIPLFDNSHVLCCNLDITF